MQKFVQILNKSQDEQRQEINKMNRNDLKGFIAYIKTKDNQCVFDKNTTKAQVVEYLVQMPQETPVKMKEPTLQSVSVYPQKTQKITTEKEKIKIERYFVRKYMDVQSEDHLVNKLRNESPERLKKFYYLSIPNATNVPGRVVQYFTSQNMRSKYANEIWKMIKEVKKNPKIFYEKEFLEIQNELNIEKATVNYLEEEQLKLLEQQEVFKQKIITNIQKLQFQMDVAYNEELIRSYQIQIKELRNLLRTI